MTPSCPSLQLILECCKTLRVYSLQFAWEGNFTHKPGQCLDHAGKSQQGLAENYNALQLLN